MSGTRPIRRMSTRATTPKVRVTKSLLDGWLWSYKRDSGWEDFIKTLNREPLQPTQAMLDGVRYENCLNSVLNGESIPEDHEWYAPITEMADELQGAQQQVNLFADTGIEYGGYKILLHGVLDYLRESHIWDCKYSKTYYLNKYHWEDTTQTALYLALVPEAMDFTYIISDGNYVYREKYPREIVPPIDGTVINFCELLERQNLFEIFTTKWRINN